MALQSQHVQRVCEWWNSILRAWHILIPQAVWSPDPLAVHWQTDDRKIKITTTGNAVKHNSVWHHIPHPLPRSQHPTFYTAYTFYVRITFWKTNEQRNKVKNSMINKNTSLMQLISIYFTYSKSLHVSGRTLSIIRRIWYCTFQRLVLVR